MLRNSVEFACEFTHVIPRESSLLIAIYTGIFWMNAEWHYSQNGRRLGPVTLTQLQEMLQSGRLDENSLVWKPGMTDWVAAGSVSELFPPGAPVPPPLPQPEYATKDEPLAALSNAANAIRSQYHKQRIALCIAAAVGMLSTFMPWVSVPFIGSFYGTQLIGWLTFLLFIPALVLALRGNKLKPIIGRKRLLAAIPAGFAGLIGIANIVSLRNETASANPLAALSASMVKLEIGIFLLIIAAFTVCLVAWLMDSRSDAGV